MVDDVDAEKEQQTAATQKKRHISDGRRKRRKIRVDSKQERIILAFLLTALGILILLFIFFRDSWPKFPQVGIE